MSMNHCVLGAYLSASSLMRLAVSSRRWWSVASLKKSIIFSTMTSTLLDLVMRYSKSSVFFRRLSSGSVRQSTTAIWCSVAYFGLMFTMQDSASSPAYLRLLLEDLTNLDTTPAQCSSSTGDG